MPDSDSDRPGRSTGPRSIEGKANSSQNANKHGCCSKKPVLPDESEEEFNDLKQGWLRDYEPTTQIARSLVARAHLAEWYLIRAIQRYNQTEQSIYEEAADAMDWSEAHHERIERFTRYRTTQERAFARALSGLEHLRTSRVQESNQRRRELGRLAEAEGRAEERAARARVKAQPKAEAAKPAEAPKTRGPEMFQGQNHPKNQRQIATIEQWAEITVEDGKTVTQVIPSNAQLIEEGKAMLPPPDLVYRRMNFVDGIPPEYHWATQDEERRRLGMCGLQRMTVDTWLDVIDREEAAATGHLGPTGVGNLPRPKERGGCDCEVCTGNQAILDRRAEREKKKLEEEARDG